MTERTRIIPQLDMNTSGKVKQRVVKAGTEMYLDKTLAGQLYPDLKVALVTLPTGMVEHDESSQIVDAMLQIVHEGVNYRLVGSGGGAKNGHFYFADEKHAPMLHARFQNVPEYLISYFGIQMGECKLMLKTEGRILVVPDNELGTNDCRGWIKSSLHAQLKARFGCFYQFRLGWALENGKGSFKVMKDDVAEAVGADIIIPESSCKPAPKFPAYSYETRAERTFTGEFVVGYREVSKELVFGSSYTLAIHMPMDVIRNEAVPQARKNMIALKNAFETGNHVEVVKMIGRSVSLDDFTDEDREDRETLRTVEAALIADASGAITRHPYIHSHLDRLMAKYAFKQCCGGGLHLPGFALADDGYLFLSESGEVISGSDWIPEDIALTNLNSKRSLCVRYPVRMMEDLLPMNNCDREGAIKLLVETRGLSEAQAAMVADEQLFLTGTYTLHSQTAKKNGGDYDFDQICVVDEALYPMFVNARFTHEVKQFTTKNKVARKKSKIWNLEDVAWRSLGNLIGRITNGMMSCLAANMMPEFYELVDELQKEIDSLKHNIKADQNKIKEILEKVPKAPWLNLKNAKRVSELIAGNYDDCPSRKEGKRCECVGGHPLQVLETDRVGAMFNMLREDFIDMLGTPAKLTDFTGLFRGQQPTAEMLKEADFVYRLYCAANGLLRQIQAKKQDAIAKATAELKAAKEAGEKENAKQARKKIAIARAELQMTESQNKEACGRLVTMMTAWGQGKTEDRRKWVQAIHEVVSRGNGNGGLVFHAFPQEAVDAIAERTGGTKVKVEVNPSIGTAFVLGDTFYMQWKTIGEAKPLFRFDIQKNQLLKLAA